MTYEEAREYTEEISRTGSILGLESIENLMRELGNIQEELSVIHIAGTNGKGSTGTFLSYALMEAGYRVGRYTSPAVFSPLEVWQINGTDISIKDYTSTLSQVKNACDILVSRGMPQPTIFEVETAVAFLYFYQQNCDYVLLETGMGGATDATNVIRHPVCSVITSVSMDHMQFLGNTLSDIAKAKAGIIKRNCPVVTVTQSPEVSRILSQTADKMQSKLLVADTQNVSGIKAGIAGISYCYTGQNGKQIRMASKMAGGYQIENSLLAAVTLEKVLLVPLETIAAGMAKAVWPGRFEVLREHPLFLMDGAHNEGAAFKLAKTVENYFTNRPITYIIGVLADKEHEKMLREMLPYAGEVFTVTPANKRALDGRILAEKIERCHVKAKYCATIEQAVEQAVLSAGTDGVVLAFGSLSYLGEVKKCLSAENGREEVLA